MLLCFCIKQRFIVIIFSLLCLIGCSKAPEDKQKREKAVFGSAQFDLTLEKKQQLAQQAEKGDAEAARKLALYYYLAENDNKKGFYWNEKAAANGHIRAQFEVGQDYLTGTGPTKTKDFRKAKYWLQKAALKGDGEAKKYLTLLLSKEDIKELSNKAEKGNDSAAYRLYQYYYYVELEHSVKELYWLKKAAKNGNPDAQYELGRKLINSDMTQAIYWYTKAAQSGHVKARAEIDRLRRTKKQ
jgi:TPR repeat protein